MTHHLSRHSGLDVAIEIASAIAHPPNTSVTLVKGDAGHNAAIVARYQAAVAALDTAGALYGDCNGDLSAPVFLRLSARRDALRRCLYALRDRAASAEYA